MLSTIIQTKLHIPQPSSNLIPRPQLIEQLEHGLKRRLTLVSAPPGFGKTTMLSAWADKCSRRVAWLSLEEADNDPARFRAYFLRAIQPKAGTAGTSIGEALQGGPGLPPSQFNPEAFWCDFVNGLQIMRPLVLVLDDYHLIQAAPVHAAMEHLIDHQPMQMHLVISTRTDPPLPLPRLRARGQLREIRATELRFSREECERFLNQGLDLGLSSGAIDKLEAHTEGWIAGLQLAALSLRDNPEGEAFIASFDGEDRHVLDYLASEVLQRQEAEIQDFLVQTSLLNRFNAPLCEAVLTDFPLSKPAQEMLEQIEARNLFLVALDHKRQWYRYHHLYGETLQSCLNRRQPQRAAVLHRRASEWYESAGDLEQAIYHAFSIPDLERVALLLEQYGGWLVNQGQIGTLLDWIQRIPDAVIAQHAFLCVGCGWVYALNGLVERAEACLEWGEAALPDFQSGFIASEKRVITQADVRSDMSAVRAYCARMRGESSLAQSFTRKALEEMPGEDRVARGALALNLGLLYLEDRNWDQAILAFSQANELTQDTEAKVYISATALGLQGNALREKGALSQALDCYRRVLELYSSDSISPTTKPAFCLAYLGMAQVYLQRYELSESRRCLAEAQHYSEESLSNQNALAMKAEVNYLLAQFHFHQGDLIEAEKCLEESEKLVGALQDRERTASCQAARGEIYLKRGDLAASEGQVQTLGLPAAMLDGGQKISRKEWSRLPAFLLVGRLRLAQKKPVEAGGLMERVAVAAQSDQQAATLIEARSIQAVAYQLQHRSFQAERLLAEALTMAEPEKFILPFVRCGEGLNGLLRRAIAEDVQTVFAEKCLTAGLVSQSRQLEETLYRPLTIRERQILRLLAAGLSSTEISEQLVISVSTVRSYIKNIHHKLDVHNREEAIACAGRLGLL